MDLRFSKKIENKKILQNFQNKLRETKFARNFAKGFSHYEETLGNYRATIGDYRETAGSPSRRTTTRPYSATISTHL